MIECVGVGVVVDGKCHEWTIQSECFDTNISTALFGSTDDRGILDMMENLSCVIIPRYDVSQFSEIKVNVYILLEFSNAFTWMKIFVFNPNFSEAFRLRYNWKWVIIDSCNCLAPHRPQVITWRFTSVRSQYISTTCVSTVATYHIRME